MGRTYHRPSWPPAPAPPADHAVALTAEPHRVVRVLALVAGLILVAGVLGEVARIAFGHGRLGGLVPLFNLDAEANVPAFYSALVILACAAVLALLAVVRRRQGLSHARTLAGLAALVAFLAVDEAAGIHELVTDPLRAGLDLGGPFHFAWVVAYGLAAAALLAVLAPAVPRLPRDTRRAALLAVTLYLAGALGLELVAGAYLDSEAGTTRDAAYAALTTVEEALEIVAVLLLLLRTLLAALRDHAPRIRLDLAPAPPV